jgi:hypothetical protein
MASIAALRKTRNAISISLAGRRSVRFPSLGLIA